MNNILFDCERMRHPHTGLYQFCLQLGMALIRNMNATEQKITIYAPQSAENIFGSNVNYLHQKSIHKFWFPETQKFNVWHGTYQSSNYAPSGASLKKVITIHDLNFLYEHTNDEARIKRSLKHIQHHINKADEVCTISEYVKQDVQKHLSLKNKNVTVVYNGGNVHIPEQLQEPALKPASPFIFTIGTIMRKKNFHVLPALLVDNDFHLLIAGITQDESYLMQIKETAKALGVLDRVVFTGAITDNDKQWYLQNCMAFAFPSIAEGFGLPAIEAMAFGKPIFLSTTTSLPEIGGDVAYYFNSFEPVDMQQVFNNGLDNYNATQPQQKIKDRAAMFSWDEAAKQYLNIYNKLIEG